MCAAQANMHLFEKIMQNPALTWKLCKLGGAKLMKWLLTRMKDGNIHFCVHVLVQLTFLPPIFCV